MENSFIEIEQSIREALDLSNEAQEEILTEVSLRTNENPQEYHEYDPESIAEPSSDFPKQVKDLVLHFALRATSESADGIIPLSTIEGEDGLLTHIEAEFERVWGDHATDRLAEADDLLGSESAAEEAYPNLRAWLEEDLFEYHVSTFDRTPILWRFTTDRLVSDPVGEGFGCLVDYHRLDEGLFDRLQNRYLEPRKTLLRERRSAANRRRGDDSLSTSEQAEAAEEYTRCESGLEQIAVFEDRLAALAQPEPREWSSEEQQTADAAAEHVAEFRRRTEKRLEIVDELAAMDDVDMGELFTGNFYEKVEKKREEWLDALGDLEAAFDAYAADPDQPVEAHRYDLFDYFADDLLGSSHFASNGILYMTYYFDKFEQADQAQLDDAGISRRQRLISRLASDLDEYIELGESISDDCEEVSSEVSSDWADRALSEVTTAGYRPNHKHGVEINITPLADAEIVPKTVDDDVL
jgi:1,2-phenylacetyl-CoA epoxidase PaaB subunit